VYLNPYRIFQKIEPILRSFYRRISEPPIPNLKGDRDIEYSWIAANMPEGPGEALDFGSGPSCMGLIAVRKRFNVTAVDIEPIKWFYKHSHFKFIQGDIFKLEFSPAYFDLIINFSTIEHVGLAGRYRTTESRPDGDIEAMKILKTILKPNGTMLLTIPVGRDKVFTPCIVFMVKNVCQSF
jgi:SAM-dependent methyltransferase